MALFDVQGLSFSYPGRAEKALNNVSLTVGEGEFLVLCGKSGCGKSTLLRHLKTVLTPFGAREGTVLYKGAPLEACGQGEQAAQIGYVLQSPDNQIVTDKVWHELAFGLESLGLPTPVIRLRVAEMASYFGIGDWYYKSVTELSGGQKQILNLASVMAMQPEILVLDEPTSQLDPIAASEFLATLKKINNEIGTAIFLSEHRLEEALPLADRVVVMEDGAVAAEDTPARIGGRLAQSGSEMLSAMPTPVRVWVGLEGKTPDETQKRPCPVTVREGREYLAALPPPAPAPDATDEPPQSGQTAKAGEAAVGLSEVWFRYEKNGEDVLRGLSLQVPRGALYALVGGNGAGKTTALNAIAGLAKPYRGKVTLGPKGGEKPRVAMLSQDPQTLFLKKTVGEDLRSLFGRAATPQQEALLAEAVQNTGIGGILNAHPYDVSGGEQQRAALAKVLLTQPDILLLDEPTKGMDSFFKEQFAGVLRRLAQQGVTVVMVSHDIEFCARHATRCGLFFDGSVIAEGPPRRFFAGNSFYTTAAGRMCRTLSPAAVTVEDIIELWSKKPPSPEA